MTEKDSLQKKPIIAIVGPTAVGKTAISIEVSKRLGGEVVSVDSMQVYRHMDIGTAKITREEMEGIPHHLIDIIYPDNDYDAAQFVSDASCAVEEIHSKTLLPLLVGGTGLYLKSFMEGIFQGIEVNEDIRKELHARADQEGLHVLHEELSAIDRISANRIHVNDKARVLRALEIYHSTGLPWSAHLERQGREGQELNYKFLIIGLTCEREHLYKRINLRSEKMLDSGLEEEVHKLINMGYGKNLKSMSSIGYRHMINYLDGVWSKAEMMEFLARDTRRYAKRQYTWFKKTKGIEWFDYRDTTKILNRVAGWSKTYSDA